VEQAVRVPRARAVGWGPGLLAGFGAGIIAALACVVAHWALHEPAPPSGPTAWSALVAGILGGLLYAWLGRVTRHPAGALWIVTLALATIDSLLIAFVPMPSGPGPRLGVPIVGLIVPLRQLAAFIGIGHLGTRHFAAGSLPNDILSHYVTALAVSIFVPRWTRQRSS